MRIIYIQSDCRIHFSRSNFHSLDLNARQINSKTINIIFTLVKSEISVFRQLKELAVCAYMQGQPWPVYHINSPPSEI